MVLSGQPEKRKVFTQESFWAVTREIFSHILFNKKSNINLTL